MAGESAREEARRARIRAERLARRAEMFERGAEGEATTAGVLSMLPADWTVIHDVRWPSRRLANIDHVVVGPGGIFVIDSKNWSGEVTVKNGHLRQNGRSREKVVASCADAGLAIAELAGPYAGHVNPVLSFASDKPMTGWCRDVMVCSTPTLLQMLLSRPMVLGPREVRDASLRLDARLLAAATAPQRRSREATAAGRMAGGHFPAPSGRNTARSKKASRRRSKALVQLATSLTVVLGFLAFGPQISTAVGTFLAEQVTKEVTTTECDERAGRDVKSRSAAPKRTPPRKSKEAKAAPQRPSLGKNADTANPTGSLDAC